MVSRRAGGVNAEESSVPEFVESLKWFFGEPDVEGLLVATARYKVDDLIGDVTGPLLIVHGEDDRQIPVEDARKVHAGAVNSSDLELRIFTREESGSEHCGIDNQGLQIQYIADWLVDRLNRGSVRSQKIHQQVTGTRRSDIGLNA